MVTVVPVGPVVPVVCVISVFPVVGIVPVLFVGLESLVVRAINLVAGVLLKCFSFFF